VTRDAARARARVSTQPHAAPSRVDRDARPMRRVVARRAAPRRRIASHRVSARASSSRRVRTRVESGPAPRATARVAPRRRSRRRHCDAARARSSTGGGVGGCSKGAARNIPAREGVVSGGGGVFSES